MKNAWLLSLMLTVCAPVFAGGGDDDEIGSFDDIYEGRKDKARGRREREDEKFQLKFGRRSNPDNQALLLANDEDGETEVLPVAFQVVQPLARERPDVIDNFRHHARQRHVRNGPLRRQDQRQRARQEPDLRQIALSPFVYIYPVLFVARFVSGRFN